GVRTRINGRASCLDPPGVPLRERALSASILVNRGPTTAPDPEFPAVGAKTRHATLATVLRGKRRLRWRRCPRGRCARRRPRERFGAARARRRPERSAPPAREDARVPGQSRANARGDAARAPQGFAPAAARVG